MSVYSLPDLSKFPDCSALSLRGTCTRLSLASCQGEGCTFKRSFKEDNDSLQLAYKRISSLDTSTQKQIAKKYYGGLMPWKRENNARTLRTRRRLRSLYDTVVD